MKTSKSPEKTEITPSKKKLKQARLPFKLISDVSPKPAAPQTRKRKLSASDTETVTKIGKISKENDLVEEAVIISDDDSRNDENPPKEDKSMNPFVKLVDTAWKKKLQKSKKKKGGNKSSKTVSNGSVEVEDATDSADNKEADSEIMDVDETPTDVNEQTDSEETASNKVMTTSSPKQQTAKKSSPKGQAASKSPNSSPSGKATFKSSPKSQRSSKSPAKGQARTKSSPKSETTTQSSPKKELKSKPNEVIILEDSTNPDDTKTSETDTAEEKENNTTESHDNDLSQNSEVNDTSTIEQVSEDSEKANKKSPSKKVPALNQITPKRSARNIAKAEQNNNSKGSPSKLNESMTSDGSTPKQGSKTSRSSSVTNSQGDVSLNESATSTNLTPKQLQKRLESAKKKEEREKEKQEREKKRQQEKEERAKLKQEKEDQKKKEREEKEEAKRKEKEEKEEQRRKEKEEKEKQKELEKKIREEKEEMKRKEKEEKEEQRKKEKEAREEERRKKQEALELEKQEQELKKKKAAEAFVNFFVPKQKTDKEQTTDSCISKTSMLSNFMIKNDMRLAPLVRVDMSQDKKEELVKLIEKQTVSEKGLYLNCLKDGTNKPLSSGKTWPLSDKDDDDDVMIVEDELPMPDDAGEILTCEPAQREKLRPKLLSFHENRRPPYWGTWRKKSACVKPRRPFGQDEKQLDYEVDSDEEWEEEQEGESIDGSAAGSDDEQDADEYEVDNVVFVPHGYLSDEEATMDEDDMLSLSPETQKQRLKHLEDEFESEMKKPTEKLKPRMYGLLWETADGGKPEKCVDALWNYFGKLSMIMNDPTPLLQPASEPEETEKKKVKKKKVPKEPTEGEPKPKSPKNEKKRKSKADEKEKTPKSETKKNVPEAKKNQPGINMFLKKLTSS
ncbi:unnamed protein product [Spodoptera littoralis]|uniref:Chromatin assembly factor 1 subunit A n=1 Tax=Spodoptera littoralis TaxID=7109 RepID=A0A9P0HZH2_SPOLI|nr:unnamed protein product [Spodoptera littoralis]CAH1637272.1 unnamed protein product [Spodoptera littoralis]